MTVPKLEVAILTQNNYGNLKNANQDNLLAIRYQSLVTPRQSAS
jgi:hypothetical protein